MLRFLMFSFGMAGCWFLIDLLFSEWVHPQIWIILAFLFITSLAGHAYLQRALTRDPNGVMVPYLGLTGLRLMTSFIFVVFLIKNGTSEIFIFLLNFFLIYFLYVGFEIYWLVTNLRRNFR